MTGFLNKHKLYTTIKPKVFVAMSGGVDSSVVAFLLTKEGYDVYGVFMKEWTPPDIACTSGDDRIMAARVAAHLGIPFAVWDFSEAYEKKVADYMLREYKKGGTPNPDVMCNKEIKFRLFLERARKEGADYIATGHYTHIRREIPISKSQFQNKSARMYTAKDDNKDQTYFLWTLTQNELAHVLFPIGDYKKDYVRRMAKRAGLPSWDKKDSQGVCFVGKFDFAEFLRMHIPDKPGNVLDAAGKVIGTHDGATYFTIGQRHGFVVRNKESGIKNNDARPLYVASKNIKTNTITVVEESNSLLTKKELTATDINWISGEGPTLPFSCHARIRYRQPLQEVGIINKENKKIIVQFKKPQTAISPGQSIVFYAKDGEMLGGGIIDG